LSITTVWLGGSAVGLGGLLYFRDDLEWSLFLLFLPAGAGVFITSLIGLGWLIMLPWARREPTVGLVMARFDKVEGAPVSEQLGQGARETLEELGILAENILELEVAGAWELPWGAGRLIQAGCQAVVATGVVVRGETHHFNSVVDGAVQGLIQLQVQTGVPVGNAVLAVSDWEQAVARSRPGANAGAQAARAVVNALRSEITRI
ncbi:MAG: 6,7-dimethyl-8-ribityllumazine synthase, partial [Acidimicrobiia bacterium]|nr:6,7-dimethyl-8-ribityllumazine synthase [Acidimicrobiia bacterium]